MSKRAAEIRIKRVYDAPDVGDGTRVLVDRLWPAVFAKKKRADAFAEGSRTEHGVAQVV